MVSIDLNPADPAVDNVEARFRAWVPAAIHGPKEWDLVAIYDHYGLPQTSSYFSTEVDELVCGRVADILTRERGPIGFHQLRQVETQFILRAIVDGESLEPYLSIVHFIKDRVARQRQLVAFEDTERWQTAIAVLVEYFQLTPAYRPQTLETATRIALRTKAIARSIQYLRRAGYTVAIFQGEPVLTLAEATRAAHRLETLIQHIGAMQVIVNIFRGIEGFYDYGLGRYLLVRRYGDVHEDRPPAIPVGYLLQLAAKNLHSASLNPAEHDADWHELLELSQALGAIYNVEPYHNAEVYVSKGNALIGFLDEIATYDSLFTFPQMRPTDVSKVLPTLFSWLSPEQVTAMGASIDEFTEVAIAILGFPARMERIHFSIFDLLERLENMPVEIVMCALDAFAHPAGTANAALTLPHEQEAVTFSDRPLIALDDGTYILLNRSWCAPGFFEALAGHARRRLGENANVEKKIGDAFEVLVRNLLQASQVPALHGKYRVNGRDGECDAVVETNRHWIFIETKKKVLTRASRGANTIRLAADLAKSLIDMQNQLAQHEILLRRAGEIRLRVERRQETLTLGNREVERIAVSMSDYGGFQDRIVASHILEGFAGRALVAADPARQTELDELAPKLQRLGERFIELRDLGAIVEHNPFLNCWFISLGQLMVMLDNVDGVESFRQEIFRTRHMSFASLDLYFEYNSARAMH